MADQFDPYREALVFEERTVWPAEYGGLETGTKLELEKALHASAEECASIKYIRIHTGFCRQITVTDEDYDRVG